MAGDATLIRRTGPRRFVAFAPLSWGRVHRSRPGRAVPAADEAPLRVLLPQILPALVVGIGASLLFLGVSALSEEFKHVLWEDLPDALGIGGYSSLWMIVMLTATGIAVGLVVEGARARRARPGDHRARREADRPGGGAGAADRRGPRARRRGEPRPENPIIASNIALAYWLGRKAAPAVPGIAWVSLASAATIGALFGTPVAAALVISEALAGHPGPGSLWDRLFAPLVAAGAGATTTNCWPSPPSPWGSRR